jgi:signal transduction histidine kinase
MPSPVDAVMSLLETTKSITGMLDLDQLLQSILDQAVEMMGAERGYLILLGSDSEKPIMERLQVKAAFHIDEGELAADNFHLSRTAILKVIESQLSHHSANALEEPDHSRSVEMFGLRSILCEPLRVHERLLGVLYLDSRITSRFSSWCREILPALAAQAAICIENAQLVREREEALLHQHEQHLLAVEMETWKNAMAAFVSIASHDLKGPLTVFQNGLVLLERLGLPEKSLPLVHDMKTSVDRARRLVEMYLDASALQEGRQLDLKKDDVDLYALAHEELTLAEARLDDDRRDKYSFRNEVEPGLTCCADRERCRQIMANLLENAIKYGHGAIRVAGGQELEQTWFEVRDEGKGIPEDSRGRLFERYFRAEPNSGVRGTGLGLWIVRQLVESQGGKVSVESRPGEGAAFKVYLPTAKLALADAALD